HGEGLNDHGEDEHGVLLNREAIHVPLIVKLPGGRRAGETVSLPAALVDVFPTVGEALGAPPPAGLAGRSLVSAPAAGGPARRVYSETLYPRLHPGWGGPASLICDRKHYIQAPPPAALR